MPLGMHVDLGPGHIVLDGLDGDPDAATEKGTAAPPPTFWPVCCS